MDYSNLNITSNETEKNIVVKNITEEEFIEVALKVKKGSVRYGDEYCYHPTEEDLNDIPPGCEEDGWVVLKVGQATTGI